MSQAMTVIGGGAVDRPTPSVSLSVPSAEKLAALAAGLRRLLVAEVGPATVAGLMGLRPCEARAWLTSLRLSQSVPVSTLLGHLGSPDGSYRINDDGSIAPPPAPATPGTTEPSIEGDRTAAAFRTAD